MKKSLVRRGEMGIIAAPPLPDKNQLRGKKADVAQW